MIVTKFPTCDVCRGAILSGRGTRHYHCGATVSKLERQIEALTTERDALIDIETAAIELLEAATGSVRWSDAETKLADLIEARHE